MFDGTLDVRVVTKVLEATDIMGYILEPINGGSLPPFTAGSHIDVRVPGGYIRQYSLCNAPDDFPIYYQICVLRERESRGGSANMHDRVMENDMIRISSPRNHFPLIEDGGQPLPFACGIGATPIIAMAERLSATDAEFEMHYCVRSPSRAAFRDRIQKSPWSEFVTFHFDDGSPQQRLDFTATLSNPVPGRRLYVCGPEGFLDAVRTTAEKTGWPMSHVHFEYFITKKVDKENNHELHIRISSSGEKLIVPADKSIVEVLAEHGIKIPVSCEQGICGTCLTPIVSGVPDHRDMILTDEEKAVNDRFTPCCSRALSECLTLDL